MGRPGCAVGIRWGRTSHAPQPLGVRPADAADATLGEVLRGERPGRTTDSERSVYAPVGLPRQDLAVAWAAYRQAERLGVGTRIDLLR
ncbi:hypothetical protein [Streptomyces atratus]|uniref:hypothetical protein n=1 Tax=Streptomyces atratus TaxID=1893 RepID=UPI003F541E89